MSTDMCLSFKINSFMITCIICKLIFSQKIRDLGSVSTKKGMVSDGGGGVTMVKFFFVFLDDSCY